MRSTYSVAGVDRATYLYIDAENFRAGAVNALRNTEDALPESVRFNWEDLRKKYSASKVFYYEAPLNSESRPNVAAQELQKQIDEQSAYFEELKRFTGYHVQLGILKRSKRRGNQQKLVDVQLAVDMLTHSYNKCCKRAVLVTGDLDLLPVVEALVSRGTWVKVVGIRGAMHAELIAAADEYDEIIPGQFVDKE